MMCILQKNSSTIITILCNLLITNETECSEENYYNNINKIINII